MEVQTTRIAGQAPRITGEALQTLEGQLRDVWPLEEGDDSVFLSDEDEDHRDIKENSSWAFGAGKRELSESTDESDVSACREALQFRQTHADLPMLPEQHASAEKDNPPAEEDVLDTQEGKPPYDSPNEENTKSLNVEAGTECQVSGDRKLQIDPEPKGDHNIQIPVWFDHISGPGCSTLPLPIKDDHQKCFNHLTSSKYSTVSYRRIRKGNTQQKIEKFESMMNL